MNTKADTARIIASKITLHKAGVTAAFMFDIYGEYFEPKLGKQEGINIISKAFAALIELNEVRFDERNGNSGRVYYPVISAPAFADMPIESLEDEPLSQLCKEAMPMKDDSDISVIDDVDTLPKPSPTASIDLIRTLLARVSQVLVEVEQLNTPFPDAGTVVNDLLLTADMLRKIRPDLAASIDAAHQYILQTSGANNL